MNYYEIMGYIWYNLSKLLKIVVISLVTCVCVALNAPPLHDYSPHHTQEYQHPNAHNIERQSISALIARSTTFPTYDSTLLLASDFTERNPLNVQTQSQQMNDAMVLKSMRGTQWRVVEERSSGTTFGKQIRRCKSLATFSGFVSDANKGTVSMDYLCKEDSPAVNGRWVTKPSRLARGSIQLSARWKVKLSEGTVIYKGFIDADKIMGKSNKSVAAEMVGIILTGDEVNKEKIIGRFSADFVRELSADEQDEKIGISGGGPITLSPIK